MQEKMKCPDTSVVMQLSPAVIIPSGMRVDCSYPDYSAYFEPTVDITRHILENTERSGRSIPDFSDYFEPVVSSMQTSRMFR